MTDEKQLLNTLCKEGIRITMRKNQYFSSNNNEEKTIYYLVSGVCALVRFTQNGEEVIYHYFKAGDCIGGVPLYLSHNDTSGLCSLYNYCSLFTKTECVLYKISFSTIERMILEIPEIGFWINKCTARHFMSVIAHVHSFVEDDTAGRLCKTLLELAYESNGKYELERYFTNTELAKYLGVHSVTVSKLMGVLKRMEVIEKDGHKIVIRDMGRLTYLAENPHEIGEFTP